MKTKLHPLLLAALVMGASLPPEKPPIDELEEYFKTYNTTLEEEYKKVQQKKSGLSARLRNEVIYRYEKAQEDSNK